MGGDDVAGRSSHLLGSRVGSVARLPAVDRRGLSVGATLDGMVSINGFVDPIGGSTVMAALDAVAAASRAGGDSARSRAQRRADALAKVCRSFLDGGSACGPESAEPEFWVPSGDDPISRQIRGGVRPHVSVVIDLATLRKDPSHPMAKLGWVGPISAEQARLLACDSAVTRVLMDGPGHVLDVGRATRTIPAGIRRAV